jgi:hypothetical protein
MYINSAHFGIGAIMFKDEEKMFVVGSQLT